MYRKIILKLMDEYGITCRKASEMCGINSSGFVTNVIKGRKDFTKRVMGKFIKNSPFSKNETSSLVKLHEINDSKNILDRKIKKIKTKIKNYQKKIDSLDDIIELIDTNIFQLEKKEIKIHDKFMEKFR